MKVKKENINKNHPGRMLAGILTLFKNNSDPGQKLSGVDNVCKLSLPKLRSAGLRDISCCVIPRITGLRGDGVEVRAFTLIELLVVVLIIGILSAIALPQYQAAVAKSRAATVLPLLKSLTEAQERYYLANNQYAENFDKLDITVPPNCVTVEYAGYTESGEGHMLKCDKYFLIDYDPNKAVNANYCPDNNTDWDSCADTREFQMNFRLLHRTSEPETAGQRRCSVHHQSALGKRVCAGMFQ